MSAKGRSLPWLHALTQDEARSELLRCCGSSRWASAMADRRPFDDVPSLLAQGDAVWASLDREDWLEAFAAHPRIGSKRDVAAQSPETRAWAEGEQAGADAAADDTRRALQVENDAYGAKFGYIFIVCATGKSAEEMLALCRARLANSPEKELPIAAEEQRKITRLRLEKLVAQSS